MKEKENKKVVKSKPKTSSVKKVEAKKVAPKKVATKAAPKKTVKKETAKPAAKKVTKKVVAKPAAKPVATKAPKKAVVKKAEVKAAPKKTVKKVEAKKPVAKKDVTAPAKKKVPKVVVKETKPTPKKVVPKEIEKKSIPTPKVKPKTVKVTPKKETPKVVQAKKPEKVVKENSFDFKRYIYFVGLVLLSFIIIVSVWDIASFYSFENYNRSYLVSSGTIKSKNELSLENANDTLSKVNGDYFIYIGYTNSKDVYKLEKQIKKLVRKYGIENKFYYINVTKLLSDPSYIEKINNSLKLIDVKISKVPTIIYVNKDNEIVYNNVLTRNDNNIITIGDFQKLLDTNGFTAK